MFSILGGFFGLLLSFLCRLPQRVLCALDRSLDGLIELFYEWLIEPLDSPQRTVASAQSSTGPPGDWLTLVRSFLWPTRLARVRVPSRRSIH